MTVMSHRMLQLVTADDASMKERTMLASDPNTKYSDTDVGRQ